MTTAAAASVKDVQMDACEEVVLTREQKAHKIVMKNMYWAMGLGVLPVPIIDLIAVAGFQAKALKELSDLYEIPYTTHTVKNTLAVLISGLGTLGVGLPLTGLVATSFLKFIPVLGTLTTIATVPVVAGALTYATGRIFIQHFESGGTFLTFNPQKVRDYYRELFQEGLQMATAMNESKAAEGSDASKKSAAK